ncbi:Uncharacterized protein Rs2_14230 [Raphanus sativus]|nr:Uncharacterized protein Rs2_14230 [Raphanus sativus]
MKLSGVPDSVKPNGEAAVPSTPVKSVVQTGVSSGDVSSMKPKDVAAVSSGPVKPVVQTGVSSGDVTSMKSKGVAAVSTFIVMVLLGMHFSLMCTLALRQGSS